MKSVREDFTAALRAHGFEDIAFTSLRWRVAPSALHIPVLATRFTLAELWKARGRLSPWRRKHIVASYCALDDHVMIGGQYFDLRDATYTLTPRDGGTELRVAVSWRLSTRFNWYADPVMQFLLGDASENILRFYKARSEAAGAVAG